ncbi:MAG: hypothetical protein WC709_12240, partial [Thermoleophilia bacterium]
TSRRGLRPPRPRFLIALLACFAILASGCGSGGSSSNPAQAATPSAEDRAALAYIAECKAQFGSSAAVYDRITALLENGTWVHAQDEADSLDITRVNAEIDAADVFFRPTGAVPRATSPDVRTLENGGLNGAFASLSRYERGVAVAVTLMVGPGGPTAADRRAAKRLLPRLLEERARCQASREALARDLAALEGKYGLQD